MPSTSVGRNPTGIFKEKEVLEETGQKSAFYTIAHGRMRGRIEQGRRQQKYPNATEPMMVCHTSAVVWPLEQKRLKIQSARWHLVRARALV
jgi:hypothetical protein